MILSQKILQQMIIEAISAEEAECLADNAPANFLPGYENEPLAMLLQRHHSDKTWEDIINMWKKLEDPKAGYDTHEMRLSKLMDCIAQKRGGGSLAKSTRKTSFTVRPGGAGSAADPTLVGFVNESLIKQMIVEELRIERQQLDEGVKEAILAGAMALMSMAGIAKAPFAIADAIEGSQIEQALDEMSPQEAQREARKVVAAYNAQERVSAADDSLIGQAVDWLGGKGEPGVEAAWKYLETHPDPYEPSGRGGNLNEELTKSDKTEIKKMISTELDKSLKPELKKILQDELVKELGTQKTKKEIGEITKKIIKKLYKDLSFHHPYIIDRIKV